MRIIRNILYLFVIGFLLFKLPAASNLMGVVSNVGSEIISYQEQKEMNPVSTAVKTNFRNTPVVYIQSEFGRNIGAGSGVYIAPNKILTAAHVVRGNDGTTMPVSITVDNGVVQRISPRNITLYNENFKGGGSDDLAIITTNTPNRTYYEPTQVNSPQSVSILGYPSIEKGIKQGYTSTGEVARKTNAAWNLTAYSKQGSSGGPVLDENDNLIGILVATVTYSYFDGDVRDLSYAVRFTNDQMKWINEQIAI